MPGFFVLYLFTKIILKKKKKKGQEIWMFPEKSTILSRKASI